MASDEQSAVRVWPYRLRLDDDPCCGVDGCRGDVAWWIDGVQVAVCDACLLALLRVLAQDEQVMVTVGRR